MLNKTKIYNKRYYLKNKEKIQKQNHNYYINNREIIIVKTLEYRAKNLTKIRKYDRERRYKQLYNITYIEFKNIIKQQKYICALCRKKFNKKSTIVLDHSHHTKKVRGIVHQKCNLIIGLANEDVKILKYAIKYLKEK